MNKYAQTAIKAVGYINTGLEAEQAWEKASCEYFEIGTSSQKKGCPKSAFLGLFSKKANKLKSKNATYAYKALTILRNNPNHNYSPNELWALVVADDPKKHNSQMDIVLVLWENKLLDITTEELLGKTEGFETQGRALFE